VNLALKLTVYVTEDTLISSISVCSWRFISSAKHEHTCFCRAVMAFSCVTYLY